MINLLPILIPIWIPIIKISDNNITLLDIFILYFFSISIFYYIRERKYGRMNFYYIKESFVIMLMGVIWGLTGGFATFYHSGDYIDSFKAIGLYAKKIGLYLLVPVLFCILQNRINIKKLIRNCLISSSVVIIFAIISQFSLSISSDRETSLLFNPNVFGYYCLISTNLSIATLSYKYRDKCVRILAIFNFLFFLLIIFMSASRSALIGIILSFGYWLFVLINRNHIKMKYIVIVCIIIVLTIIFYRPEVLSERLNEISQYGMEADSVYSRKEAVFLGIELSAQSPLFGYGFGMINKYATPYAYKKNKFIIYLETTDNLYVDVLLDSGLIGLFIFAFLIYNFWRPPARLIDGLEKMMIKDSIRGSLIGLLIAGIGAQTLYSPFVSCYLLVLVSLLYANKSR